MNRAVRFKQLLMRMMRKVNWRVAVKPASAALVFLTIGVPTVSYGAVTATSSDAAPNRFEEATRLFESGEFTGAVIELKNVLRKAPNYVPALILIGRSYLKLGDLLAAENSLRRARAEGGDEELLVVPLANTLLLLKRYKELFVDAPYKGRSPQVESAVQDIHGKAHLSLKDIDRAEAAFSRALFLQPAAASPMTGLARVYLARFQLDAAQDLANRAIESEPENFLVWFVKAQISLRQRNPVAALKSIDRSIVLEPNHIASRVARAMMLVNLNRFDEAAPDLETIRNIAPDNPFAIFIDALIKLARKDAPGSKQALVRVDTLLRSIDPNTLSRIPPLLYLAGVVSYARGSHNAAHNYLLQYVSLDPFDVAGRLILSRVRLLRNKLRDALTVLRRAVKLAPANAEIWRLIGTTLMREARYEEATKAFERAVALKPGASSLQTALSLSLVQRGQVEEAIAGLEKALALDPEAVKPGILLASLFLRERRFDAALAVCQSIILRDPSNAALFNLIAAAQSAKGNVSAARKNLNQAIALDPNLIGAHRLLAQIDLRAGRVAAAKKRLNAASNLQHAGAQPLLDLAQITLKEGQLHKSISYLQKANSRAPDDVAIQLRLLDALTQIGDRDEALRIVQHLDTKYIDNSAVIEALGKTKLAFGRKEDAANTFRRLTKIVSDDPKWTLRIARYQLRAEDSAGAHATLKRSLVSNESHNGLVEEIVQLETQLELFDDALLRTKLLIKQVPNRAVGYRLRGDVLAKKGAYDDALKAYTSAIKLEPSGFLLPKQYETRKADGIAQPPLEDLEKWVKAHPKDIATRRVLAFAYLDADRSGDAIRVYESLVVDIPNDPGILNNPAWLYFRKGDRRSVLVAKEAYRSRQK